MLRPNSLKARLAAGEITYGVIKATGSATVAESAIGKPWGGRLAKPDSPLAYHAFPWSPVIRLPGVPSSMGYQTV